MHTAKISFLTIYYNIVFNINVKIKYAFPGTLVFVTFSGIYCTTVGTLNIDVVKNMAAKTIFFMQTTKCSSKFSRE